MYTVGNMLSTVYPDIYRVYVYTVGHMIYVVGKIVIYCGELIYLGCIAYTVGVYRGWWVLYRGWWYTVSNNIIPWGYAVGNRIYTVGYKFPTVYRIVSHGIYHCNPRNIPRNIHFVFDDIPWVTSCIVCGCNKYIVCVTRVIYCGWYTVGDIPWTTILYRGGNRIYRG